MFDQGAIRIHTCVTHFCWSSWAKNNIQSCNNLCYISTTLSSVMQCFAIAKVYVVDIHTQITS